MNNSSKILQTVASNVDTDVMRPLLGALYDMIMLTDTSGMLSGEEQIKVNGVNVAVQKETERQKQLQFLQITANPIDAPIVGQVGRARVLRAIAQSLGLPDDVVPDDQTIQEQVKAQQQIAMIQASAQAHAGGPQAAGQGGPGGQQPPSGPTSQPSPGAQAAGNQPPQATPARLSDHAPPVNLMQQGVPTNGPG